MALRNPDGQDNVKLAVRRRDGYRCTGCGMTNDQHKQRYGRQLQVHRVRPGSRYTLDGCVTLCNPCHGPQPKRPPFSDDEARKPLVSFTAPAVMRQVIISQAKKERRSVASLLQILAEEALRARGLWHGDAADDSEEAE